eukprot:3361964-Rhodomonas_salina.2
MSRRRHPSLSPSLAAAVTPGPATGHWHWHNNQVDLRAGALSIVTESDPRRAGLSPLGEASYIKKPLVVLVVVPGCVRIPTRGYPGITLGTPGTSVSDSDAGERIKLRSRNSYPGYKEVERLAIRSEFSRGRVPGQKFGIRHCTDTTSTSHSSNTRVLCTGKDIRPPRVQLEMKAEAWALLEMKANARPLLHTAAHRCAGSSASNGDPVLHFQKQCGRDSAIRCFVDAYCLEATSEFRSTSMRCHD